MLIVKKYNLVRAASEIKNFLSMKNLAAPPGNLMGTPKFFSTHNMYQLTRAV